MRRSFRTLRLCAIPGVSPRAGMQCPVGALRMPLLPASAGPIPRSPTHDSKPPSPPTSHPHPAAAGPGRNEHWRRSPNPLAQQRESSSSPEPTCERRTDPAERRRGTDPQRQPRHSATAKQESEPGAMRRSFRTLRLCTIPGVSPRAGMRCPVGALRTPYFPRAPTAPTPAPQQTCSTTIIFPHRQQSTTPIEGQAPNQRSGSGIGPERALEAITQSPRATARKLILPRAYLRAQDRSRGAPSRH
jgi:hypothetical protein